MSFGPGSGHFPVRGHAFRYSRHLGLPKAIQFRTGIGAGGAVERFHDLVRVLPDEFHLGSELRPLLVVG